MNLHIKKEDAKKKLIEDGKYYAKVMSCFLVLSLAASTYSGNFILVTSQFFLILLGVIYSYKIVKFFSYEYLSNGPVKDRHIMIMFSIILIIGFLAFSSDDSDSPSSSLPPRGGDVELELKHRDAGYSELSYVVYFDDKEGPSGTLAYGENIWYTLCGNCEGSHTIEVYWGDGDDCQADIEVVGSSDEIWQCTNR